MKRRTRSVGIHFEAAVSFFCEKNGEDNTKIPGGSEKTAKNVRNQVRKMTMSNHKSGGETVTGLLICHYTGMKSCPGINPGKSWENRTISCRTRRGTEGWLMNKLPLQAAERREL